MQGSFDGAYQHRETRTCFTAVKLVI